MSKSYQLESEIMDDLQGRIEVFDQSIRSFEKRLRAVERRLSLETPQTLKAGNFFSGMSHGSFQEVNPANLAAGPSVSPQGPSVSPETSFPSSWNSPLSDSVSSLTEGDISAFAFSAVHPSSGASNASSIFLNSSSEVSGVSYRVKDLSALFTSLSESLHSLQAAISELSDFVHSNLEPEVEKLDNEIKGIQVREHALEEYMRKFESRIEAIENRDRFTLGSIKVPVEISGIAGSSVLFLTGLLIWFGRWDIIRSPYFSIGLAVILAGAVLLKFYTVNRKQKSLTN
ncbi:hypothetical protein MSSAC_0834 [Methanosarcina siciliae C2J]|uniref:Uncharacterized protein n=1 Tax=Methanosarcina siciliae C2J TaxID=1434118 RepID=A0A0E3PK85_9EURY|nr:hypothetical protein [Methanosarcina siciliae]AKB35424.1 hypothetical protein MSSAC_0834 [Methanosarcina siciliae C2J]